MKTKLTIVTLICVIFMSCEKNNDENNAELGNGFEIYETVKLYTSIQNFDYSKVNFDTITLSEKPILSNNDLISYDTANHKLSLGFSHDSINFDNTGVRGSMFVVTIDNTPIYCGFKWRRHSSVPPSSSFIEEPYRVLDSLEYNEIVISFISKIYPDPRSDKRILDRLKKDNKIKK